MNSLPPLNGLRAFEASGRHQSFQAAADELGVTQSAVAQQVRGLEKTLDQKLFHRSARGLAFTDIGRGYHAAVTGAFAQLRTATAALRPAPSKVTISVPPAFAAKWLLPHLSDFTRDHPGIDLRVLATEKVSSFRSDSVDLAVQQGSPPFGASLDCQLLFKQEIVAICAPGLLARSAQLSDHVLLHDALDLWPRFAREVLGQPLEDSAAGLRFNQTSLCIDAAIAGQGIALASRFLVARDLEEGRLVRPIRASLKAEQDFYLLAPRGDGRSDAARNVWDWIVAQAG